ncbi:demethylmenaquinone methyltransferase [Halanaerobaculum tunisiense]
MTKGSSSYIQSVFETIASDYDFMNWVISLGLHQFWRTSSLNQLDIQSGDKVLDVCCGTCNWTVKLAQIVGEQGKVIGLDFSPSMLEVGQQKLKEQGLNNQVELIKGNALELPFASNKFDYVVIGFGLRNVTDIYQCLAEMRRVVKPDGLVASLDISKPLGLIYRRLFFFYVYKVVPVLAKLLVDKPQQYTWLPQSLTKFPNSEQLKNIFYEVGLREVQVEHFVGGGIALHLGLK